MKKTISIVGASLALALAGPALAEPFEDFFQEADPSLRDRVVPFRSTPRIFTSFDIQADGLRLCEDGYAILGVSSFVGPPGDLDRAQRQGRRIRAEVVIYSSTFVDTRSGGSVIMPHPFGLPGALVTPMEFSRYNQTAFYFARLRPEEIGIGVTYRSLRLDQARELGSSRGLEIVCVIRGSPAFDAGIILGDIVLTLAGRDVSTRDRLERVKVEYASQTVDVEISRAGETRTLQLTLPVASLGSGDRR